jgi:CxxC motif-containing protein (DUF1111 family)
MNARPLSALLLLLVASSDCASEEAPPTNQAPLGSPRADLSPAERAAFERGRELFTRVFEPATGLGPYFNDRACIACHDQPAAGGQGSFDDRIYIGLSADVEPDIENFQHSAIPGFMVRSRPADASRTIPPSLYGIGLLERVPEEALRGHGCNGGAFVVINGRVARFGTRPFAQTVRGLVSSALFDEMGISNIVMEDDTLAAMDDDRVADPEVDDVFVRDLTAYVAGLAPAPALPSDPRGAAVFERLGCATCHRPETGPGVRAFTDMCIHNMGPAFADGIISHQEDVVPRIPLDGDEFRTMPLWGMRLRPRLLHTGQATSADEAIRAHGGEAAESTRRYTAAPAADRALLLAYLNTL